MNAAIDQSLDEIISAKKRTNPKPRQTRGSGVRKVSVASTSKARPSTARPSGNKSNNNNSKSNSNNNKTKADKRIAPGIVGDADAARSVRRVVVSNLPRNTTEEQVRDFMTERVAAVSKVIGAYDSRGKATGSYTVTFRQDGSALKALQLLHHSPVDGGVAQLRVELLFEASRPQARALVDRIGLPADVKAVAAASRAANKGKGKGKSAVLPVSTAKPKAKTPRAKATAVKVKAEQDVKPAKAAPKKKAAKKRSERPAKTAEELDAEMVDYFANTSEPEIA